MFYLIANDRTLTATAADTEAARALVASLADGPVTVELEDYGGFEKVGSLPQSLPASDTRITTSPGDIMLYQGRDIVVFYGSNTWSYTPLGKIEGATSAGLREFFGHGDVRVTLSLNPLSGLEVTEVDSAGGSCEIYDLTGRPVRGTLSPGFYIINGKKTLVK
ncbi:MAG: hypothetical protein K2M19_04275 [Muribaculaceae bacterium]|nr:hypothetical protein [Muribaculaceae bacterium]